MTMAQVMILFYISSNNLKNQHGLTLLEMLVVVFILSAIALMTLSFTNNADDQFRYEDTRTRLLKINRAIVGSQEPVFESQSLLSGFVVDNGILPANLQGLVQKPAGFDDFGPKNPIFDPLPDVQGLNDGGVGIVTLNSTQEIIYKGHR